MSRALARFAAPLLLGAIACSGDFVHAPEAPSVAPVAADRRASISFTGTSTEGFPIALIGTGITPYAISNTGSVVGQGAHGMAFLWTNGVVTRLPLPGIGNGMQARGINSRGQVVGIVQGLPRGNGAFLYENGQSSLLLGPPGSSDILTQAITINEYGVAGGVSFVFGRGGIPVLWHQGVATDLGGSGSVSDVNDSGIAVGASMDPPSFAPRATIWRNGQRTVLPIPAGYVVSAAEAVNNHEVVVGNARDANNNYAALLWTSDGQTLVLPSGGGQFSFARDVSDDGVVVGEVQIPGVGTRAAFWRDGRLFQLGSINRHQPNGRAWAINRDGIIAGNSGTDAVLWKLEAKPVNQAPIANAGDDRTVKLSGSRLASVQLDGSASTDDTPQSLTYTWTLNAATLASGVRPTVQLGIGVHTVSLTVSDGELQSSDDVVITVVDPTPPVIEPSVIGQPGNAGWYRSDVTVQFSVTDAESDIVSAPCADVTVSEDTAGQQISCTATSAGGSASATVSVKRDATSPTIAFTGALAYTVDQQVAIHCQASDAMSGLASTTCANVSGPAYEFDVGANTRSATAEDKAGNVATASVTFTVTVTAASLCNLVERWVAQRGVAHSMCVKLRAGSYEAFANHVRAQAGKHVSSKNAATLLRLVQSLR